MKKNIIIFYILNIKTLNFIPAIQEDKLKLTELDSSLECCR